MSGKESVACRVPEDTKADIEMFRQACGHDKESQAVAELVKTGLRQQKNPLIYQWQQHAIQATHYLVIAALVVLVLGISPAAMQSTTAMWTAAALMVVGVSLLAAVELLKTLNGQGELGHHFQRGDRA